MTRLHHETFGFEYFAALYDILSLALNDRTKPNIRFQIVVKAVGMYGNSHFGPEPYRGGAIAAIQLRKTIDTCPQTCVLRFWNSVVARGHL